MNGPYAELRLHFQLSHWQKARLVPFPQKNRAFVQDVDSTEITGLSTESLTLRLAIVVCRTRWTLSVHWKLACIRKWLNELPEERKLVALLVAHQAPMQLIPAPKTAVQYRVPHPTCAA
jgi:hypothetical protein